jgi:FMN phosphatase YigB (HAD superfamily)/DNA-binding XRE family transcriptional regulator
MDNGVGAPAGGRDEKWLGKRVQEVRKSAGLTQQGLCHAANLSYSTLAKIERGAIKAPSIFTIQSIALALNTTLDELMETATAAESAAPRSVTKSGVRFVYFDVNGCLVQAGQRALTRIAEASNTPVDVVETLYWRFNDEVCRGTMSMSDFSNMLAERLHFPDLNWQEYYLNAVEVVQPMQELVRWAHEHYQVGLITNIMPGLLSALKERGLLPDLTYHAVIDSSEVGIIKPSAEIFRLATERAGVQPQEILLIDDTQANLQAAQRQGWHVLLLDDYDPTGSVARARTALEPAA